MTTTTTDLHTTQSTLRPALGRFLVAAAVSGAGNLIIFGAASIAGIDLLVPESPGSDATIDLAAGAVVVASVLPLAVALAAALVLRRRLHGRRIFTALVAAGFILSYGPLLGSDMDAGTALTLAAMHPVVAAAALWQLRPVATSRTPPNPAADGNVS
jgi:drug/metabolite transporter (DMT)-like permease